MTPPIENRPAALGAATPLHPAVGSGVGWPGLSVLVVGERAGTATVLRHAGHRVRTAPDGPAAVRLAGEEQPDVVLLEIGLPGVSGHELVAILSRHPTHGRRPLLIAVNGHEADDRRRSAVDGIDLHLVGPVDPDALLGVLRRFERVIAPPRLYQHLLEDEPPTVTNRA